MSKPLNRLGAIIYGVALRRRGTPITIHDVITEVRRIGFTDTESSIKMALNRHFKYALNGHSADSAVLLIDPKRHTIDCKLVDYDVIEPLRLIDVAEARIAYLRNALNSCKFPYKVRCMKIELEMLQHLVKHKNLLGLRAEYDVV